MNSTLIVCLAVIACVCAMPQVNVLPGHEKDMIFGTPFFKGMVFGKLGSNDQGLFGTGGYRQDIFNDHRGKLAAEAYGTRVIGPVDSTNFGGRLDWNNQNAQAAIDVNKQIGAGTSVSASGSGVWKLDKNTEVSAGGSVNQNLGGGKPDVAVQAQITHDF